MIANASAHFLDSLFLSYIILQMLLHLLLCVCARSTSVVVVVVIVVAAHIEHFSYDTAQKSSIKFNCRHAIRSECARSLSLTHTHAQTK